jgi:hypothetical protein
MIGSAVKFIEAALTIISANKMPEWLVIVIFTGTAA